MSSTFYQIYMQVVFAVKGRQSLIQLYYESKEHHKKQTFKEEYLNLLKKLEIKFEEQYLFDFLEF